MKTMITVTIEKITVSTDKDSVVRMLNDDRNLNASISLFLVLFCAAIVGIGFPRLFPAAPDWMVYVIWASFALCNIPFIIMAGVRFLARDLTVQMLLRGEMSAEDAAKKCHPELHYHLCVVRVFGRKVFSYEIEDTEA